ncbi:MAG: GDSL-type esterase/lipase family protein [Winogradskyella sp.]|uniref:GDSL-type esterase/lipase family protein n=1 Tax=Winogradskyella sp. TaxID=1883156 RepID=UPI00385F5E04
MKILFQKITLIGCLLAITTSCSPLKRYTGTAKTFESQVRDLERRDRTETFPEDYILYIGSSSIRLWDSIHKDMAPYHSVKRGYGGAHFYDLIQFTERLVTPHKKAKALVCFVANDLTGVWDEPKTKVTPKEVNRLFRYFTKQVEKIAPEMPIFLIEITATPSRWNIWRKTSKANDLMKTYCETKDNLHFISTSQEFLDENQQPRPELFVEDQLHLNREGYKLWTQIIKSNLDRILK